MPRGLRRFFVDASFPAEGASLRLSPRETFHLSRVLRLKSGDGCQIFNRDGLKSEAFIETISESQGARLQLKKILPSEENFLYIRVGQALPQKKKLDGMVQKAEELGIQELWVLETQRSQVKMRPEAGERARKRWERIVIEAAKQSGSPVLTRIEGPRPFEKVIEENLGRTEKAFLFHPEPEGLTFSHFIEGLRESHEGGSRPSVFLLFGPEGGFTDEEVRWAESQGVRRVFLGNSTLRLETAFLGVLSSIRFLFG